MNYELNTYIGNQPVSFYVQIGFFDHKNVQYPLHNHSFPEIHIFSEGSAVLECDNEKLLTNAGDAILIPAYKYHKYSDFSPESRRITFLINSEQEHNCIKKTTFPQVLAPLICDEINSYYTSGNDNKIKELISFICSDFFESENKKPLPVTDREFIIREFFAKKYNLDISINELAKELSLSSKQTAREIKKYTGQTFREQLAKTRVEMAKVMMKTTDLPLSEISRSVGYSSYSGFYKAYRRFIHD